MSAQDSRITKVMELLEKNVPRRSAEEASQATGHPVELSHGQQKILDSAVEYKTGEKRVSFYLPGDLVDRLDALAERGIDPTDLITITLEVILNTAESLQGTINNSPSSNYNSKV